MCGACRGTAARAERGVTLIELMIAMLLGLLLTAGVIQVFVGNRATYVFNDGLSRIQENARFALDHIAGSLRIGGYAGCLPDSAIVNNLGGAANPFRDDLAAGIQGFDYSATGTGATFAVGAIDPAPLGTAASWSPALPTELSAPARVIPGSDVLVVRNAGSLSVPLVSPFSTATEVHIAAPSPFAEGQVLVASDCLKASIFQVTDATEAGGVVELEHTSVGAYVPGNSATAWSAMESYGVGAELAPLQTTAFYVGRGASGRPSLFQLRLQRLSDTSSGFVAEELVEGVDTMQVRYGLDTTGDRQVDSWQTADTIAAANNWDAVLSVQIALLARSTEEYGMEVDESEHMVAGVRFVSFDDRRLRKVFSTTVGVRNRLP